MSPEHIHHPHPTKEEKISLSHQTNISIRQVENWFTNARRHKFKPVVTNGTFVEPLDQTNESTEIYSNRSPKRIKRPRLPKQHK